MLSVPHIDQLTRLAGDRPFLAVFAPCPGSLALVDPLPSVPFDAYTPWSNLPVTWLDSTRVADLSCRSSVGRQWRSYIDHHYPGHLPSLVVVRSLPSLEYLAYRRAVREAYRLAGIPLPRYPGE